MVETPGGLLLAEIDVLDKNGIDLVGIRDKFPTFENACLTLRQNAEQLLGIMHQLSPQEVEISFGIKVGVEGGNAFWGLAKASSEANYSIRLKWSEQENQDSNGE